MAKKFSQTYTIDLQSNPSDVISALKQIQSQMSNLTTDQKIFDNLKTQFDKLQILAEDFKAEVASGVKSPNDFTRLTNMANSLEVGMNRVIESIQEIAKNENGTFKFKNVEDAQKKITELQKEIDKIQNQISESQNKAIPFLQGLEMTEQQAKQMAESAKSQEQLVYALKRELEVRQQIYAQAKQMSDNDDMQQRAQDLVQQTTANQKFIRSRDIISSNTENNSVNQEKSRQKLNRLINEQLTIGLGSGSSFNEIWDSITNSIGQLGLTLDNVITDRLQRELQNTFSTFEQQTQEIAQNLENAERSMNAIGTIDNNTGEVILSAPAQQAVSSFTTTDVELDQFVNLENTIDQINSDIETMNQSNNLNEFSQAAEQVRVNVNDWGNATRDTLETTQQMASENERIVESFDRLKDTVKTVLSISTVWTQFRNILNETFNDIQSLDKAFGSIAMVTNKTVGELWNSYDDYAEMANELGQSTESAIQSSALYYQQG